MRCPECGGEIRRDAPFCGKCGFKMRPQRNKIIFAVIVFILVFILAVVFLKKDQPVKTAEKIQEVRHPDSNIINTIENRRGRAGSPVKTAVSYTTVNSKYKTIGNAKFNFWFDIPVSWDAEDRSVNGDGYSIAPDAKDAEAGVFGQYKIFPDEEFFETMFKDMRVKKDFIFRDGKKGKYIVDGDEHHFLRDESGPDRWIAFYIKCADAWFKENSVTILYIARSLRPGKRSGPEAKSTVAAGE
jgi:predicted nucleic acid-binding Zn ribbon protein